jgi:hypothetical protein
MNRLQAEQQRLYFHSPEEPALVGADGRVRAMVLELARPASWDALGKVWRGVQADLDLPAPAIAVAGIDGYQLWFSLAQPLPVARAAAFLESLRRRYLGEIAPQRIAMKASVLPPVQAAPGHWSAFVAPDLAAVFEDEPWLDLPPGADAQADLLSRLQSIKPEDLQRAFDPAAEPAGTPPAAAAGSPDPRHFLLGIMNDPAVDLRLRIEAAKALLPHFESERPL